MMKPERLQEIKQAFIEFCYGKNAGPVYLSEFSEANHIDDMVTELIDEVQRLQQESNKWLDSAFEWKMEYGQSAIEITRLREKNEGKMRKIKQLQQDITAKNNAPMRQLQKLRKKATKRAVEFRRRSQVLARELTNLRKREATLWEMLRENCITPEEVRKRLGIEEEN